MGTDKQTIIVPAWIKDFKDLRDYADFMHSYLTASQATKDIVAYALTRLSEDQEKKLKQVE